MERLTVRYSEETELAKFLHARVVGQEKGVASIVAQYDKLMAGMNDPTRPIATLLFLGPTGVGKTKIVEAFCEYLFGEKALPVKVNCGEYTHDHQIAKLIGSPAGYQGSDKQPFFSKDRIENRRTKDGKQLNVILFDEIEKAGLAGGGQEKALLSLLLGILDRGALNLSSGQEVSFVNTIIFMTSNLGARELLEVESDEAAMRTVAEETARQFFTPEQFNRLDEMVVFKALTPEQIMMICDLEITEVADRAKMEFDVDDQVRDLLVARGYDIRYGARQLKRVVDKHLTRAVSSLMASGQLKRGNRVRVEMDADQLAFFRLEGVTVQEEVRTVAPPPAPEVKSFREEGYVRRMLERKFKWGDSTGAKIYHIIKASEFRAVTAEAVVEKLQASGWTTQDAGGPIRAVKYVLHDWTKKGWAVKQGDAFQVKE